MEEIQVDCLASRPADCQSRAVVVCCVRWWVTAIGSSHVERSTRSVLSRWAAKQACSRARRVLPGCEDRHDRRARHRRASGACEGARQPCSSFGQFAPMVLGRGDRRHALGRATRRRGHRSAFTLGGEREQRARARVRLASRERAPPVVRLVARGTGCARRSERASFRNTQGEGDFAAAWRGASSGLRFRGPASRR